MLSSSSITYSSLLIVLGGSGIAATTILLNVIIKYRRLRIPTNFFLLIQLLWLSFNDLYIIVLEVMDVTESEVLDSYDFRRFHVKFRELIIIQTCVFCCLTVVDGYLVAFKRDTSRKVHSTFVCVIVSTLILGFILCGITLMKPWYNKTYTTHGVYLITVAIVWVFYFLQCCQEPKYALMSGFSTIGLMLPMLIDDLVKTIKSDRPDSELTASSLVQINKDLLYTAKDFEGDVDKKRDNMILTFIIEGLVAFTPFAIMLVISACDTYFKAALNLLAKRPVPDRIQIELETYPVGALSYQGTFKNPIDPEIAEV